MSKNKIEKIEIRWAYDDLFDPEISLDSQKDKDLVDSGEVVPYSCTAEAMVSYPIGNGSRRLEWLSSSGLYGILLDNSQLSVDDRRECAEVQIEWLREHLLHFNVEMKNFNKLAREAIENG
jgi:hypothetical protein